MRSNLKICHKVPRKSEKDFQIFKMRQERPLQGTPEIAIGKCDNIFVQIWTDDIRNEPLARLKQLNSNPRAFLYARTIIQACLSLVPLHGFFIINENMVFFNPASDILAWINPDILENHVKIYLPPTPQGEQAMIRSIVSYLKLWLRCDFVLLAGAEHLHDLPNKLQPLKTKPYEHFMDKICEEAGTRRSSVNLEECKLRRRCVEEPQKMQRLGKKLQDNRSNKEIKGPTSPGRNSQVGRFVSNRFSLYYKGLTKQVGEGSTEQFKTTVVSQRQQDAGYFWNRTFTNVEKFAQSKTSFTNSLGMKSYFPNKTTSNKNHIVKMILEHDDEPNIFGKNNILLDEEKLREIEREKLRKLKQSLHGIGEELNDLFQSGFLDEKQVHTSFIQNQFQSLLE